VEDLKKKGAIFVKELSEIPEDGITVFSAHGVAEKVELDANERKLKYFDATCPLVSKVHKEVIRYAVAGKDIVMIGHKNHPEVEGTLGRFPDGSDGKMYLVENVEQAKNVVINQPKNLYLVTQTTLSVSDTKEIIFELKKRFPLMQEPNSEDICYATQNRQDAVKQLALETQLILVVGSENSSNSNRLKELAEKSGSKSYLIDDPDQISGDMLENVSSLGITAGASAPEELVQSIVQKCTDFGYSNEEELDGLEENIYFKLPSELR
jgi:4-hydroxy-3-methylbut-2-enyl diphosphate reductase